MVRTARSISSAPESEYDDADRPTGCTKDCVVGGRYAIGVVNKILRVLKRWWA